MPVISEMPVSDPCAWSVVVPFYNEAACAAALLAELNHVLGALGRPYEILMVDDGSKDATPQILAGISAATPACRHLRLEPNRGQAAALLYGLNQARGEILITLDGDGQNDPADIPALLARLAAADHPDMVVGIRAQRKDSWLRRKISRLANGVRSRVLGDGVSDSGCALKVFHREVREAMIPIRTLYSFMPALAVAAGFRVVEMPVNHRARAGGTSSYGLGVFLWRPFLDMMGMWWFTQRRFPQVRAAKRGEGGNV